MSEDNVTDKRMYAELAELRANDELNLAIFLVKECTSTFDAESDYLHSTDLTIVRMGRERALDAACRLLYDAAKKHAAALRNYEAACHSEHAQDVTSYRTEEWLARQRKAHQAVAKAIADGSLVRPNVCERCGKRAAVVAHHHDYDEPLVVNWWCKPCHGDWHANNGPAK